MNIKVQQLIGHARLGVKRNAPELLLGLGLVSGTACVVMTGRASVKAMAVKEQLEDSRLILQDKLLANELSEEEVKREVTKVFGTYTLSLAKEYAIPAALYAMTITSVVSSYKIQKNRQLALSAALSACTTAYASLLNKIKKGAAAGLTAKEVVDGIEAKITTDENGFEVIERLEGTPVQGLYTERFNKESPCWTNDKWQNEATLRSEESWANNLLRLRGYVFLNDINERLGLPHTTAGQVVGWVYSDDSYIDFGVKDCCEYTDPTYDPNAFDLTFNVKDNVLTILK